MADNLKEKAKHLKKKKEWTIDQLIFQDHLITTLYKHYPVRNDFHDMRVITKREYNKLEDDEKKPIGIPRFAHKPCGRHL